MIKIENIHIAYHGQSILVGACFQAPNIGICSIFGESGSGKTSLLKSICLEEQQFDRYYFNHQEVTNFSQFKGKHIATLPQDSILIDHLSIQHHFDLYPSTQQKTNVIKKLNLSNLLKKYPPQLSGGEKIKVGFALALLRNHPVLVLDEPTASLDLASTQSMMTLIQDYAKNHLVIISTHDLNFITISDVIYRITNHQLILEKDHSKDSFISLNDSKIVHCKRFILYLNLKKRNKIYHILMSLLLIISITFTSFGLSRIIFPGSSSNHLEELYDNEIFVYKRIDNQYYSYYSQNGNEFPITNSMMDEISSIHHVSKVRQNYNVNMSNELLLPEEYLKDIQYYKDYSKSFLSVYDKNGQELFNDAYPQDIYNTGNGITLSLYKENKDYPQDIAIQTKHKNGIYISQGLYHQLPLEIKDSDTYYLSFSIPVPVFNAYNDAYLIANEKFETITDENGNQIMQSTGGIRIELCRILSEMHLVKIPISGVLKEERMGANVGNPTSIFICDTYFQTLIEQHRKSSTVFYQPNQKNQYQMVTQLDQSKTVMQCIPYQCNSLIVEVDDFENKRSVIKELQALGYATSTTSLTSELSTQFQNNTEETAFYISVGSLMIISFIYFIITYLRKNREKQEINYFSKIGFSDKDVRKIILLKYFFNASLLSFVTILFSLIYLYFINPIIITHLGSSIVSASSFMYLLIIILLCFLIEFVFPLIINRK